MVCNCGNKREIGIENLQNRLLEERGCTLHFPYLIDQNEPHAGGKERDALDEPLKSGNIDRILPSPVQAMHSNMGEELRPVPEQIIRSNPFLAPHSLISRVVNPAG